MPVRAVLFDFDGVIADTENHHVAAWQRTFNDMGWVVPDDVCARAMELDDRALLAELFEDRKIEGGDVEGWVRRKQETTRMLLRDAPRVYPGVVTLVETLQARGVRLAVVTTTWRENVSAVLESVGLWSAFQVVVGKEDVAATKPDPECYRKAVKTLGVRASSAVAIEDSTTGLTAARQAGVKVVAVGHRRPNGEWTGDAPFVGDLTDHRGLLETLGLND